MTAVLLCQNPVVNVLAWRAGLHGRWAATLLTTIHVGAPMVTEVVCLEPRRHVCETPVRLPGAATAWMLLQQPLVAREQLCKCVISAVQPLSFAWRLQLQIVAENSTANVVDDLGDVCNRQVRCFPCFRHFWELACLCSSRDEAMSDVVASDQSGPRMANMSRATAIPRLPTVCFYTWSL